MIENNWVVCGRNPIHIGVYKTLYANDSYQFFDGRRWSAPFSNKNLAFNNRSIKWDIGTYEWKLT